MKHILLTTARILIVGLHSFGAILLLPVYSSAQQIQKISGGGFHSLAVCDDGSLRAWGRNTNGQIGDGCTIDRTMAVKVHGPGDVGFLTDVASASAGVEHSLARKNDGTVWAWGQNLFGQLGDGTTTGRLTPVQIGPLSNVIMLASGSSHSMALKSDGTVWTWGYNGTGQLGIGTQGDLTGQTSPVQVHGVGDEGFLTDIIAISAGFNHCMALKNDGTVWTWGGNFSGQLGINQGALPNRTSPMQVRGPEGQGFLTDIVTIASGAQFSLAVRNDGTLWTWGENITGQLGDGTFTQRNAPVQVQGITGITGVAAEIADGYGHCIARKNDGTVWTWGWNQYGQLGDGMNTNRPLPAQVPGLSDISIVSGGFAHCMALKTDGTLWSWGLNFFGQLGNGTKNTTGCQCINSPVQVAGPCIVPCNLTLLSSVTGISCNGENDGTATVSTCGTELASMTWSNGQTTATVTGLSAGTYSVTATDTSGCSAAISVTITEPAPLIADAGADQTITSGQSVQIGSAPVAGITYSWSPVTGLSDATIANPIANPNTTTSYTLNIVNVNGCTATDFVNVVVAASGLSCETAIDLGQGNVCRSNIQMQGNEIWFKFVPDSLTFSINLSLPSGMSIANIDSIILYKNVCNNLEQLSFFQLQEDSIPFLLGQRVPESGVPYFLKITADNSNIPSAISFCIENKTNFFAPCPPHVCNLIGNGDFSSFTGSVLDGNPFAFMGGDDVPCWRCSHGTPNIFGTPGALYAAMWHNGGSHRGEGIITHPPITTLLPGRTYVLSYDYRRNPKVDPAVSAIVDNFFVKATISATSNLPGPNAANGEFIPNPPTTLLIDQITGITSTNWVTKTKCFTPTASFDQLYFYPEQVSNTLTAWMDVDNISLFLVDDPGLNQTIACGASVLLGPACPIPGATYNWSGAGLSCTNNCPNPTANPLVTTTYNLAITIPGGCTVNSSVTITVIPFQFTLTGPNTACTSPSVFSVSPFPAGSTASWIVPAGVTFIPSGNSITITNWGTFASQGGIAQICATVTDANGCSAQKCIDVNGCCIPANLPVGTVQYTDQQIGNITHTSQTVLINGTLTITGNVAFQFCDVLMGPNALIIVQPACTLSLLGNICLSSTVKPTHLRAACGYMWRGIRLMPGANASMAAGVLLSGGTNPSDVVLIEDADSAVVSVGNNFNAGQYYLGQTWFNKNYKAIVAAPFAGANPSIVAKTVFTCRALSVCSYSPQATCAFPTPGFICWDNFSTTTLLPPHAGTRSYKGVELDRVADIQIGLPTQSSLMNFFDNLDYGIYSTRSNLRVYNNTFQNINTTSFSAPLANGIGVYAEGFNKPPLVFPFTITVGGPGLQANTFTNTMPGAFIGFGVLVHNKMTNVNIVNNTFIRNNYSAVLVSSCTGVNTSINISNNTISENPPAPSVIFRAISCQDVANSTTSITGNNITNLAANTSASKVTTGISVQNAGPVAMNLVIQNNSIKFHRNGIVLTGIAGSGLVDLNTITFSPTPSTYSANSQHFGIALAGCSNIHVRFNTITKMGGNPTAGMVQNLRGIHVENSQNCIIGRDNTLNKMGSGVFVSGNCITTRFACNTLNKCYYGFFFNGQNVTTTLSDQILDNTGNPAPTGNVWSGSIGADLAGQISSQINWYYNTTVPSNALIQGSLFGNAPAFTSNGSICPQFIAPPPNPGVLSSIVQNQNRYSALESQNLAVERKFALRMLRENPQWLQQNTVADSMYRNFYSGMLSSTLGKLVLIEDTLAAGNINEATAMNNLITDTCAVETNRKIVNNIYINSWAQGVLSFSSADSSVLYNIAIQEPLESGDAVYSARVMLGLDPGSLNNVRVAEGMLPEISLNELAVFSKVYPNPNNGSMQLDYELYEGQRGEIVIYDLMGSKISSYSIGANKSGTLRITEAALKNGIYFYEVKVNGEIKESDKIVILK